MQYEDEGSVLAVYNRLEGSKLRVLRHSWPGLRLKSGKVKGISQPAMLKRIKDVLGEDLSQPHLANLEAGRRMVPGALVNALADDSGWDLEELLSRALHQMVHPDFEVLSALREEGRARRMADPDRNDRIIKLLQELLVRHVAQPPPRSADVADHPPSDTT